MHGSPSASASYHNRLTHFLVLLFLLMPDLGQWMGVVPTEEGIALGESGLCVYTSTKP